MFRDDILLLQLFVLAWWIMENFKIKWPLSNKKTMVSTKIFDIVSFETLSPRTRKAFTFYRLECGDWVNILPLTRDNQVVLVNQYRAGTDEFSLEIPGGLIDNGEDPAAAALRELKEETGYTTSRDNLIDLGYILPNPAIQNNKCFLYTAKNVKMTDPQNLDDQEDIQIILMPYEKFLQKITGGEIKHSLVLNTVFKHELFNKK